MYRRKAGLTGAQLGNIIGISQGNIARYENGGVKYIPAKILEKIADALSCNVSDLTAGDNRYQKREPSDDDSRILEQYHSLDPDLRHIVDQILMLSSNR